MLDGNEALAAQEDLAPVFFRLHPAQGIVELRAGVGDAVPAEALAMGEDLMGAGEEFIDGRGLRSEHHGRDTGRHRQVPGTQLNVRAGDDQTHPLRESFSLFDRNVGHEDHELIAADTGQIIERSNAALEPARNLF